MSITSTSVSTSLATPVMTTTMWQTTLASFPRRKPTSHKRHQERRKHDHHHRRRRDLWRPASKVAQTVGLKIQKIAQFIKRLDFIDMSVGSIKRLYCSQVIQTILNVRSTSPDECSSQIDINLRAPSRPISWLNNKLLSSV